MPLRSKAELAQLKETLSQMLGDNLSHSQIAERLGLTKNQVSGLVARLLRGYVTRKYKREWTDEAIAEAKSQRKGGFSQPSLPERVDEIAIAPSDVSFDPPDGKLNIYNVKASHCRYLDGEGFFCGGPISKASYCEHHYKLCYYPPRRKAQQWRSSLPSPSVNFA